MLWGAWLGLGISDTIPVRVGLVYIRNSAHSWHTTCSKYYHDIRFTSVSSRGSPQLWTLLGITDKPKVTAFAMFTMMLRAQLQLMYRNKLRYFELIRVIIQFSTLFYPTVRDRAAFRELGSPWSIPASSSAYEGRTSVLPGTHEDVTTSLII